MTFPFHPCAEVFPLMKGQEFAELVDDIKANGLREPIVEYDGQVLDGRNRYIACETADVEPRFVEFDGNDPLAFVLSANLHRRHLNESQRAMVAAKLETMKQGRPGKDANLHVLREDAARMLGVSPRSVASAAAVRSGAIPELTAKVEQGEVAVSLAAKVATLPAERQKELVSADEGRLRGAVKKHARAKRETDLAAVTAAASEVLGDKLYGVIYADPPWRFEPYSRDTGMDRAADNHNATMSLDDLRAITIPAADDAVLFLWATAPMMPEALSVMAAWGFTYKSQCVWVKDRIGTGYWFRNQHELLLVGTKGRIPAPAQGDQFASVIEATVRQHSAKPAVFAEMIKEMFPSASLLEMFAREARLGWAAWGNEAPTSEVTTVRLGI